MNDTNIISITDIIENKVRKQKELEGYEYQLEDLRRKKFWIEKEIQMAEFIIAAVQSEITPQQFIKALIEAELDKKD
jgi:hypothetical protein